MGKRLYIYLHKNSAKADFLSYSSHIAAKTLRPARGELGKENEMTAQKFLQDCNKIDTIMIDGAECYGASIYCLFSCDIPVENRSFELCYELGWFSVKMGAELIELGVPKSRLEEIVQSARADLGITAWA
jgi:hypothetical protein